MTTLEEQEGDTGRVIRVVNPELAEAVLRVTVRAPGWESEDEYPLARARRPEPTRHVQADGTVLLSGTFSSDEEGWHCLVSHADGRTPDDRGTGASTHVTLNGSDGETVAIGYSAMWNRGDECGEVEGEVTVPWLGSASAQLAGGGEMTARITNN